MQHIKIRTQFDITHTNVVRNLKAGLLPTKINGRMIETEEEYARCRKQQSNWETLLQVISLRTQPLNIKSYRSDNEWVIEFDVEADDVFRHNADQLGLLKADCENVPMITGLNEVAAEGDVVTVDENTYFEISDYDRL